MSGIRVMNLVLDYYLNQNIFGILNISTTPNNISSFFSTLRFHTNKFISGKKNELWLKTIAV